MRKDDLLCRCPIQSANSRNQPHTASSMTVRLASPHCWGNWHTVIACQTNCTCFEHIHVYSYENCHLSYC